MTFKITSTRMPAAEAVELVALRLLEQLDDEVGPAALCVLSEWSERAGGTPLSPADLDRAGEIVEKMTTLARAAAKHLDGHDAALEHLADVELLATQWLERVTGPDRPHARPAGRLGLLMLGDGQRILKAGIAALDSSPGAARKRRRGRPPRDPRVIERMLELTRGDPPAEWVVGVINREFNADYQLKTLKTYYYRHKRTTAKAA